MSRRAWRQRAACRGMDTDVFIQPGLIERDDGAWADEAKKICAQCPVASDCLAEAYEVGDWWAVMGGTTPRERRRARRRGAA